VRLSRMQPAPPGRSGARVEGPAAAGHLVRLRLYFASPAQSQLQAAAAAIADPSSPDYRHYLTVDQFRALYAPPATTIAAMNSYLQSSGLTPGPLDANGMSEPVSGRVDQLNRALHTTMQQVETATGAQEIGSTQAPALPANLAPSISYIDGLAPWVQVHNNIAPGPVRAAVKATPGGVTPAFSRPAAAAVQECQQLSSLGAGSSPGAMDPIDLSTAYRLSGFYARGDTGHGTTVGLIEYDSYDQPAVATWEQCLNVSPTIYVNTDTVSPPPSSPQTIEATADIETVMSVAPAANMAVYESGNVAGVNLDPWTAAIGGVTGIPLPAVISSSWGLCESEAVAEPGGSGLYAAESTLFSEAVTQGQSILVASGDQGSEACFDPNATTPNEALAVNDPASNPMVTGVGGTNTLTVTGQQFVWNTPQSTTAADCNANPSDCAIGGSGGGLSAQWDQPSYQSGSAALQTGCVSGGGSDGPYGGTTNGGCREVPDVSALAGYLYWEMCTSSGFASPCPLGSPTGGEFFVGVAGTSLAAPSWAGTVALADASCPSKVGFLNPLLYRYATNHNTVVGAVTSGNNDFTETNGGNYPAFSNGSQNLATGLGYLGGVDLSSGALCQQPGAATGLTVAPGNTTVTASWAAPKYDGGSAITGYTVSATPGGATCHTSTTSCVVTGLTNGSPYRVAVTATNGRGTGPASALSGWVTPAPSGIFPHFSPVSGAATAISEGANSSVWVIGTNPVPGGHGIYHSNGTAGWALVPGGAVTIAVGPTGLPWIINSAHQIFQRTTKGVWQLEPGAGTAISIGANGSVWLLGTNSVGGGHGVYQWTGTGWALHSGGGVAIAVGPTGSPWLVNSANLIFQWNGTGWNLQSGQATAISEGADGAVWIVGTVAGPGGRVLFRWTGPGWAALKPLIGGVAITVGPSGTPWYINSSNQIFKPL
jgi:subtilase family serine protease